MTVTTENRAANIAQMLNDADDAYYAGEPTILSDAAYDTMKRDLREQVDADPSLNDDDAIYQALNRVGTVKTHTIFGPVTHDTPMLSLDNVFSDEDLSKWLDKVEKNAGGSLRFSVTPKIDGVSLSVLYENGRMVRAATRGDGAVGEDVTLQAATIKNLPDRLPAGQFPGRVEVRGEVYIAKQDFDVLNEERIAQGKEKFANRRNAASGSLRQKDPNVTAQRRLRFIAFQVASWQGDDAPVSDHESLLWAVHAGFEVSVDARTDLNGGGVLAAVENINNVRDSLHYDIDGVVIKVDDFVARDRLGAGSKFPRWAIALKPAAQQEVTVLRDIELQVGRTGRVTPRAVLEPVMVGGVEVTYTTLNNASFITNLDLRIGDTITVQRAGEVIPEIVKVHVDKRGPGVVPYVFPSDCPVCGSPLNRTESADARCEALDCPMQFRARAIHWVSRKIADVDGIGPSRIDAMLDAGLLEDVGDFFSLTYNDLIPLDKVEDKTANNILTNVAKVVGKFNTNPELCLASLGIRMNGRGQARDILKHFGTINNVRSASVAELTAADGFGEGRAQRLYDGLRTDENVSVLEKYRQAGVDFDATKEVVVSGSVNANADLTGMKIVLTGALLRDGEKVSRDDIKADLEALGAKVSGSLSGNTDLLIAGEKAGSKVKKAEAEGVRVVGQDELDRLLAGESI